MFEDLKQYAEKRRAKKMAGRKSKHDPLRQMIYRRFQGEFNPNDFQKPTQSMNFQNGI